MSLAPVFLDENILECLLNIKTIVGTHVIRWPIGIINISHLFNLNVKDTTMHNACIYLFSIHELQLMV